MTTSNKLELIDYNIKPTISINLTDQKNTLSGCNVIDMTFPNTYYVEVILCLILLFI